MDERREEQDELAALDREREDERREQEMDALMTLLAPWREWSLPMADNEPV